MTHLQHTMHLTLYCTVCSTSFSLVHDSFNVILVNSKSDENKPQAIQEISGPLILERYVAIADYDKQKKNECSLMAGQTVEVVDKNQNGTTDKTSSVNRHS